MTMSSPQLQSELTSLDVADVQRRLPVRLGERSRVDVTDDLSTSSRRDGQPARPGNSTRRASAR